MDLSVIRGDYLFLVSGFFYQRLPAGRQGLSGLVIR
jgi:hypothetical protein